MTIQRQDQKYFKEMSKGSTETLADAQTKLVIKAEGQRMLLVTVDHGVVRNVEPDIRKCDFLTYGLEKPYTHLIELKGKTIKKAYDQLCKTIENIVSQSDYPELVQNRDRIDAYIVSPGQQSIPRGNNDKEKQLAELLAKRSRKRVSNIFDLVHYVRVVPKLNKQVEKGRKISCSGKVPLLLE